MRTYTLREPLGSRSLDAGDFPLTLGGPGAAVLVPGCAPGEVLALVGLADGEPFLQPAANAVQPVRFGLGGEPLAESAWLVDGERFEVAGLRGRVDAAGDDWSLVIEHAGGANETEPPLYDPNAAQGLEDEVPERERLRAVAFEAPQLDPRGTRAAAAVRPAFRLTPAKAGAGIAGALLLAMLAFLFAASPVTVRVAPDLEPDAVDFADTPDVGVGGWHLVMPGRHELVVAEAGYVEARRTVEITGESNQRIVVELAKLPGRLAIDTGGVQARVLADGKPLGNAPGTLELPAGTHLLAFEAPRHERVEQRVTIEGLGREQSLAVQLVPAFAPVTFQSVPAGAEVRVDGRAVGVTPLTVDLDAGRRPVVIVHPEYRAWESTLTVRSGEPQTVGPVELGLPGGRLLVRTEPAGADVSVAGAYRGRSPVTLELAPGAAQEVVVTRAGFQPVTRTVTLAARAQETLNLRLEPLLGEIEVGGEPRDAELFVGGQSKGAANQRLRLPAIAQQIEIRRVGLEPFRTTVTPRPGLPQTVNYVLKTPEQARTARLGGQTVRTSVGQPLKLLPAGRLVMGTPRREPGRRSNETQRAVELKRPVYLALRPVTNAEFRQFKPDHLVGAFRQETLDLDNYPVANVTWQEAAAYANWLSQKEGLPPAYVQKDGRLELAQPVTTGYRLPTEAEWEYAARWNGGANDRKYPWGERLPIPPKAGNFADAQAVYLQGQILQNYDDGFRVAAPVASFAPNPLGFHDLGGNVLEWVTDYYTIYSDGGAVAVDPTGPGAGQVYVIRGSSWLTASISELRLAWRDSGSSGRQNLGFRLARYAE
ncbi:MAG: PEGA domain-containing protein [Pseudomonadota bacterium]